MSLKVRISLPENATSNDTIEVKTLVSHPMESGFRLDAMGEAMPRNILRSLLVTYKGEKVFEALFGPGIAANPYVAFYLRATESGDVRFVWEEQNGDVTEIVRYLAVI
ncbi:MAG: sulfur-oxidizing protein SoxZ [Candidatus Azotimanducaceae bacterium]|jgi:sulfur-oxidizing protein SoxZ